LFYNSFPINKKKEIILKGWKTWDNYSLSVIYIKLFNFINLTTNNKIIDNNFLALITELFITNMHPNYNKRLSIEETHEKFVYILNTIVKEDNTVLNVIRDNITKNIIKITDVIHEKNENEKKLSLTIKR